MPLCLSYAFFRPNHGESLFQYLLLDVECVSYRKRKSMPSVPIIPIVCAMLSTSENTNSETIDVSIAIDAKKDASMVIVCREDICFSDYLFQTSY